MKLMSPRLELQLLLHERGFMLVTSLLVTAVIVTLGAAVSFTALNNSLIARNVSEITQSRYQADGGIDLVLAYLRSGEATLPLDSSDFGEPSYEIDVPQLQTDINTVLEQEGLASNSVQVFSSEFDPTAPPFTLKNPNAPGSNTIYVANNSISQNALGTKSVREAAIEVKINWVDQTNSKIDTYYGIESEKGCQMNGNTQIDVDIYCGQEFVNNGAIFKCVPDENNNNKCVKVPTTVRVGPNFGTCSSNQSISGKSVYCYYGNNPEKGIYTVDGTPEGETFVLNNNKLGTSNKLPEARSVDIPSTLDVRNTALRHLSSKLNIPSSVVNPPELEGVTDPAQISSVLTASISQYIDSKKISINANALSVNNATAFLGSLESATGIAGGCVNGTVIEITGSLPLPQGASFENCIVIVKNGDLSFNGSATHKNTAFMTVGSSNINFNGSHTFDNSAIISSGGINLNNAPQFQSSLTDADVQQCLDSGGSGCRPFGFLSSNTSLNINGSFSQAEGDPTELYLVSQGDINFNGSVKSTAGVITGNGVRFNGNGGLTGFVRSRGTVTMNGGIDTKDFEDPFRNITQTKVYYPVLDSANVNVVTRQ